MAIGILSMQKVVNFGSYLQAFALKSIIESLGHETVFVDIRPGKRIVSNSPSVGQYVLDRHILKRIHHVFFRQRKLRRFRKQYFHDIGIDAPSSESDCEKIVIGSDEVFNCCQPVSWGCSMQLFGDTSVPAISYAASCGHTSFEQVQTFGLLEDIAASLRKLAAVSVRDENTADFVRRILGVAPLRHLDPVLVFDWDKSIHPAREYKNYILVYAYDNRINSPAEINAIKAFAKRHGKKLISFGLYQRWCDKNVPCAPLELLFHFDHADFVVTDTFHGTVFSIKRNKPFATLIRDSNRNKLLDLLRLFDLTGRQVTAPDGLESVASKEIDWLKVNHRIRMETDRTLAYLTEHL